MTVTSQAEVVVVGGGSTGVGIARDLAMRGVDVVLFERGNFTDGTTGRMHGLLHSGARYAVTDQGSARDCIKENRILREIASHCVEETGGLFVRRPEDSADYFEEKLRGCNECGIPTEVLAGAEVREREPYLHPEIEEALSVPDAAVDPFRVVVANALDAEAHGARIETHAAVTDLLSDGDRITGVAVEYDQASRSSAPATDERIRGEHVINATGAWAGQLAAMADLSIDITPSKGVMVVTNCRQIDTVVNRCVPKGDADIIVPHETTAILGTTDVVVDDPDEYQEAQWEVDLVIEELSKLVPILADARTLRSYWGIRPLYDPGSAEPSDPTSLTREFALIDHGARDGVPGFTSVVGGKFATYRKMAEEVSDHVCALLGISAPCRTASNPLPGSEDVERLDAGMESYGLRSPIARRSHQRLGSRAATVLDVPRNPVLCECEAVTRAEIRDAIQQSGPDLNSVRIRTRASMGNCQGGICAHRLAAELVPEYEIETAYAALDALYEERWKGQRHAMWGEQLSQMMLNHALHATTMNRDRDPARTGREIDYEAFDGGASRGDSE